MGCQGAGAGHPAVSGAGRSAKFSPRLRQRRVGGGGGRRGGGGGAAGGGGGGGGGGLGGGGFHRRKDARGRARRVLDPQLRAAGTGCAARDRLGCGTDDRRAWLAGGGNRGQAGESARGIRRRLVRGTGVAGRSCRPGGGAAGGDEPPPPRGARVSPGRPCGPARGGGGRG